MSLPTLQKVQFRSLFDTMYLFISFGESTPLQNRQFNILIGYGKQQVGDFVGQLTFYN